jgi:hypothetical protein
LAGVKLASDEVLELPFGSLRRARPGDFSDLALTETPPGAVFECRVETLGHAAKVNPFSDSERREAQSTADERLTRILLSLALSVESPVQEHVVFRSVRFTSSSSAENPPPISPVVASWPFRMEVDRRIDALQAAARSVAEVPITHLSVATRRFLLARSERTRPEDQIVDFAIALEDSQQGPVVALGHGCWKSLSATNPFAPWPSPSQARETRSCMKAVYRTTPSASPSKDRSLCVAQSKRSFVQAASYRT